MKVGEAWRCARVVWGGAESAIDFRGLAEFWARPFGENCALAQFNPEKLVTRVARGCEERRRPVVGTRLVKIIENNLFREKDDDGNAQPRAQNAVMRMHWYEMQQTGC